MNFVDARRLIAPLIDAAPTLALVVFGGWLAARWLLYFVAPVETPEISVRERTQLGAAAQTLAAAHLFGKAPAGEVVSNVNVKLRGVFAGGGTGTGYAIVNAGGRDEPTRTGAEIVPGVTLEAVHAGHIVVRRGGALERVNLEERTAAQAPPDAPPRYARATSAARRSVPAPAESAALAAPQSSGPGTQVRRPGPYAPVGGVPTDAQPSVPVGAATPQAPAPLPLSSGSPQGLVIQDVPPGSMLERIGLEPGDVVRSVNGEPVASEADVARIVQSRALQGALTAEVTRGGTTLPLSVTVGR